MVLPLCKYHWIRIFHIYIRVVSWDISLDLNLSQIKILPNELSLKYKDTVILLYLEDTFLLEKPATESKDCASEDLLCAFMFYESQPFYWCFHCVFWLLRHQSTMLAKLGPLGTFTSWSKHMASHPETPIWVEMNS